MAECKFDTLISGIEYPAPLLRLRFLRGFYFIKPRWHHCWMIRTATCACQKLNVECKGEPVSVSLCSCKDCQRRTGSAFGIAAFFEQSNVCVDGEASCYSRTSEAGFDFSFYFCPTCGTTVYWQTTRKKEFVVVAGGAFADPKFPAPTKSVFEENKYPWLDFSF